MILHDPLEHTLMYQNDSVDSHGFGNKTCHRNQSNNTKVINNKMECLSYKGGCGMHICTKAHKTRLGCDSKEIHIAKYFKTVMQIQSHAVVFIVAIANIIYRIKVSYNQAHTHGSTIFFRLDSRTGLADWTEEYDHVTCLTENKP